MFDRLKAWLHGAPFSGIAPLVQALPYRTIDSDQVIHSTQSRGWLCQFTPVGGWDPANQASLLQCLVKHLPDKSYLHLSLSASPYVSEAIDAWGCVDPSAHSVLRAQGAARASHFKTALSSPWDNHRESLRQFTGLLGVSVPTTARGCDLVALRSTLIRECQQVGLMLRVMDARDCLAQLRMQLNAQLPTAAFDRTWHPSMTLAEQAVYPGTCWHQHATQLNAEQADWCVTPLMAARLPETFTLDRWSSLLGNSLNAWQQIGAPFSYHMMMMKGRSAHDEAQAVKAYNNAKSQLRFTWAMKCNPLIEKGYNDWKYTHDAIKAGNDNLVSVMVSAAVASPQATHEQAISQLTHLGTSQGIAWQRARHLALPLFLMQCPLFGGNGMAQAFKRQGRFKTLPLSSALPLCPLVAPASPPLRGMLLTGMQGELTAFDNFSPQYRNYNVAVTGTSGSGKSVFIQELIARNLSHAARRVFVLDIGRSYEALCHVLGGQYIDFATEGALSFNPFTHIGVDEWRESKTQILTMVMAMVGLDSTLQVDSVYTLIANTLNTLWQTHGNDLTFTHLMQAWLDHPSDRLTELGLRLQPFTRDGDYGAWFEPPCTVDFTNVFVVLELEHLKPHPRLMRVMVMTAINAITTVMYRAQRRDTRVMCVMDEAWDLFNTDAVAQFLEEGYRRARKYNGSFVAGTQSLLDFAKTSATRALIQNADILVSLSQDDSDVDNAVNLGLIAAPSAYERALLRAVTTQKGRYAECVIKPKNGTARLVRLVLEPFSRILYASDPARFNAIRARVAAGMDWIAAVEAEVAAQ